MMFKRIAIVLIALAAIFGALYGAYHFGASVQADADQVIAQGVKIASDKQHIDDVNAARQAERDHAVDMAVLDSKYQKVIENEKAITESTIADLRTGTVSLRKQLAAVKLPASTAGTPATSTGSSDATYSPGLREADAGFLVRLADDADAAVNRLAACQAIVRADRK